VVVVWLDCSNRGVGFVVKHECVFCFIKLIVCVRKFVHGVVVLTFMKKFEGEYNNVLL